MVAAHIIVLRFIADTLVSTASVSHYNCNLLAIPHFIFTNTDPWEVCSYATAHSSSLSLYASNSHVYRQDVIDVVAAAPSAFANLETRIHRELLDMG